MKKILRIIISFVIVFIIAYLIVGYLHSNMFARIHWTSEATVWNKLREYYIRTAPFYIKPTLVLAVICTGIINIRLTNKK